jgi:hypothetical protein
MCLSSAASYRLSWNCVGYFRALATSHWLGSASAPSLAGNRWRRAYGSEGQRVALDHSPKLDAVRRAERVTGRSRGGDWHTSHDAELAGAGLIACSIA